MISKKDKKILALIPARAGSKSIPKKNILDLGGHPLLAYCIAVAKLSRYINRVLVSTDSKEFAEIAKKYGAEVPFLRPKIYATDTADDKGYTKHALDFLEKKEGYVPDMVVHLRPTTPLRDHRVIDRGIKELMSDKQATALRSAHISDYPAYKSSRLDGKYFHFFGREDFSGEEEYYNMGRQTFRTTYHPNGYVDIILPKVIKKTDMLHGKKIYLFQTDKIADIDNLADFDFAQKLLSGPKFARLLKKLNQIKQSKTI